MIIGVPKEIKPQEYRAGLVPASIRELIATGNRVLVEESLGTGIGISDAEYKNAGAEILASADDIFAQAEMIVKVKEPQPNECAKLRSKQILFTYLHLAPDPMQAKLLQKSNCSAIAYETVTDNNGGLPLLTPMSQVAGRMSIQAGAAYLEKVNGGRGVLLGGVPGVSPANVVIIGGGVVGTNAARMAMGAEAHVTILDKSLHRLQELDQQFGCKLNTIFSTTETLEYYIKKADLVVGAVLIPGAAAPKLVSRQLLRKMQKGAVIVDVAIDQGGCFTTSRATTHQNPTYVEENIIHYCVANMPGAVPRTSTFALNNATLPFVLELANKGLHRALSENKHLYNGLNVHNGKIIHPDVARDLELECV